MFQRQEGAGSVCLLYQVSWEMTTAASTGREGSQEVRPNPAAELLTRAQLGPCRPPGPHVLCFHHVHRPGWAPAKPSLAGEGQAGAVPGSAEALGQEQQSCSQESWGIKLQASGDSGIRLLSRLGDEGRDDLTAATLPGTWGQNSLSTGLLGNHLQRGAKACCLLPLCPQQARVSQPGAPLLQPGLRPDPVPGWTLDDSGLALVPDPRLNPPPDLGSHLF